MQERAVHVSVTGLVQGVGYRAWVEREAGARGLSGWVRNRFDGSVEAVFTGPADEVEAMLAACRQGPRLADGDAGAGAEHAEPVAALFRVLPTQ